MNARRKPESLEQISIISKQKYVTVKDGALLFSMGMKAFRDMALDAGAVINPKGRLLVNVEIFDNYLQNFKVV